MSHSENDIETPAEQEVKKISTQVIIKKAKAPKLILPRGSVVKKNQLRIVLVIALSWTLVDFFLFCVRLATQGIPLKYSSSGPDSTRAILLRELNVFLVSLFIGYILISVLRNFLRNASLWYNLLIKTLLLVGVAVIMNFFIHFTYDTLIDGATAAGAFNDFLEKNFTAQGIFKRMPEWILLFILTLLAIEVNEKYSPGVFLDIMLGKYVQPKEENRIIMFIDLKNSTPIAEKLGHKEYFKFIRDVIFCISAGVIEHEGRIYQYVGDEIVVWWPSSKSNARKAVKALIEARKVINKNSEVFKRLYDVLPEYKVGVHVGEVTVGQIGVGKKELIMSGDTINTAARIRTASSEMNQKFVVSKDMVDLLQMKDWQSESLGLVDLKGKNEGLELFALKI
jgi:adenylate cyclase